jgi:hypothetical protein
VEKNLKGIIASSRPLIIVSDVYCNCQNLKKCYPFPPEIIVLERTILQRTFNLSVEKPYFCASWKSPNMRYAPLFYIH